VNGFSVSRASLTRLLGGGALAFGALGVVNPGSLARLMETDVETARAIGFRDVGSALLLLGGGGAPAIVQRIVYDLSDALLLVRRKPAGAAAALGFAALGAYALSSD